MLAVLLIVLITVVLLKNLRIEFYPPGYSEQWERQMLTQAAEQKRAIKNGPFMPTFHREDRP